MASKIRNKKKMMDHYSDDVISLASSAKAICQLSYVLNESADVKIQEFFVQHYLILCLIHLLC
jgi:hypothetical protein